jgi:hypothetical protein
MVPYVLMTVPMVSPGSSGRVSISAMVSFGVGDAAAGLVQLCRNVPPQGLLDYGGLEAFSLEAFSNGP